MFDIAQVPWGWIIGLVVLAGGSIYWLQLLRERMESSEAARQACLTKAAQVQRELIDATRQIPPDPGRPYSALIDETRLAIDQGATLTDLVRKRGATPADQIAWMPGWSLLFVVPALVELSRRLSFHWRLRRMQRWTAQAESALGEARRLLARIAGLGQEQKDKLGRLGEDIENLRMEIEGNLSASALSAELQRIQRLLEQTAEAGEALSGDNPPMPQVVRADPILRQIESELRAIRDSLAGHQRRQARLRPVFQQVAKRLQEFRKALAEEEEKAYPLPEMNNLTNDLENRLTALEGVMAAGNYETTESGLKDVLQSLGEYEKRFDRLLKARQQADELYDQTRAELDDLQRWLKQCPREYEMDTGQDFARQLQIQLATLERLQQSEDPDAMRRAQFVDVKRVRQSQKEFEDDLEKYDALRDRYTVVSVNQLQQRARQVTDWLSSRSPVYQSEAKAARIQELSSQMVSTWRSLPQGGPGRTLQSQLRGLVAGLSALNDVYLQLEKACQAAEIILDRLQEEHNQAVEVLSDPLFREVNWILQDNVEDLSPRAENCRQRREQLATRLGSPGEDFNSLLDQAKKLRAETKRLYDEYYNRLDRHTDQLTRLDERMAYLSNALKGFQSNKLLDLQAQTGSLLDEIDAWRERRGGMQQNSLAKMSAFCREGDDIVSRAQAQQEELERTIQTVNQRWGLASRAVEDAERALNNAEKALQRAQNSTQGSVGAALWPAADFINQAKKLLAGLQNPVRRRLPEEALQTLDQVQALAQSAQRVVQQVMAAQ